jgi:hypothetical protein
MKDKFLRAYEIELRSRLTKYELAHENKRKAFQELERCRAKLRLLEKKMSDVVKNMEG